mgnify:CR=1 FL=1
MKCQLCNTFEDEFHFLLECPLNYDLRPLLIDKYYWKQPNMITVYWFLKILTLTYFAQVSDICTYSFLIKN